MKILPIIVLTALAISGCSSTPSAMKAFRDNDTSKINTMMAGQNINSAFLKTDSKYPESPLAVAAYSGNVSQLKRLVAAGADPNYLNPHTGENALYSAIIGYKTDNLAYLLEAGTQMDVVNKWGRTPLASAVYYDQEGPAEVLKRYGAKVDQNVRLALRERREKDSKGSGFNFGKALALGAGAVIGGGTSLSADQQAAVLGGIIADSMEGVEGVSNMENSIDAIVTNSQNNDLEVSSNNGISESAVRISESSSAGSTATPNPSSSSDTSVTVNVRTKYSFSICREEFPRYKKRLGVISSIKTLEYPDGRDDILQDMGEAAAQEYERQIISWNEVSFERRSCFSTFSNTLENAQTSRQEFINNFNAAGQAFEYK